VTTAVLLAARQPLDDGSVIERLALQLRALGVEDLRVITRPEWAASLENLPVTVLISGSAKEDLLAVARVARDGDGALVVGSGDVVTHRSALDGLLTDPRVATGILAADDGLTRLGSHGTRTERGRVLSVGSPYHAVARPNNTFLGVVKVAPVERETLAQVAERLAAADLQGADDVPALLAVGLVRSGVRLTQSFLGKLFWARPASLEELERATEEIARVDEDRVLLDSAVKANDGFFTTFFVSPYSKYIARWAARRGFNPNQVTTFSMLVGVAAAAAFAFGTRAGLIAGAVLLQAAFTFDCVDGQLARYTRTFSKFGAWLDSLFDRGKEYVVFAGLAIGSSRAGDPVWLLASAALTFQTVRHYLDFSFGASEHHELETAPQRPLDDPADGVAARPAASGSRAKTTLSAWERTNRLPGVIWIKRMLPFPIGERFAVISITAALFTPRTTFVVVLAWGAVAAAYTLAGRLLRSVR
jgi:phosphatidylglycerophosphate synthase